MPGAVPRLPGNGGRSVGRPPEDWRYVVGYDFPKEHRFGLNVFAAFDFYEDKS